MPQGTRNTAGGASSTRGAAAGAGTQRPLAGATAARGQPTRLGRGFHARPPGGGTAKLLVFRKCLLRLLLRLRCGRGASALTRLLQQPGEGGCA